MTPDEFNIIAEKKATELNSKIKVLKHKLNVAIGIIAIIYVIALIVSFTVFENLKTVEIPLYILSAIFAAALLADMFSLYMYILDDKDKDTLLFVHIFKTYDYVQYQDFWIFYQPGLRSTYYFLDKDFDVIIRNLHLKPGYQKQLNNELNAIGRDEVIDKDASINKLIKEINIAESV